MTDVNELESYFFDEAGLQQIAEREEANYRGAEPFPHIVLEGFLPEIVAAECATAFPGRSAIPWDPYDDHGRTKKLATQREDLMPMVIRHVVHAFNSGAMIRFLERLTGISGLVADPHLVGGGLHLIEPGGYLDVHADFNVHPLLKLDRRLNVLLYLNEIWDEAWGGELEFWDRGLQRPVRRIAPLYNRCVIFNTTDTSYHGHPEPLRSPAGESRRSLAFYYYSNGRPEEERAASHSTLYRTPGGGVAPVEPDVRVPSRVRLRRLAQNARTLLRRPQLLQQVQSPKAAVGRANHWERLNAIYATAERRQQVARPQYTWSLLHAADVAATLGYTGIAAVEFGVAGGNGLIALEQAAQTVEEAYRLKIDIHGFDTGEGLPAPVDHRDAPYLMKAGHFPMDETRLRARLRRSELHIGLVKDTLMDFEPSADRPIGFVAIDVDYYSSTVDALGLFTADASCFLPRVLCYFDDIVGYPWGPSNGELLAIKEFNERAPSRALDPLRGIRYVAPASQFNAQWTEAIHLLHVLDHARYNQFEDTGFSTTLDLSD